MSPKWDTFLIFLLCYSIGVNGKNPSRPFRVNILEMNYEYNKNLAEIFYLKLFPYRNSNALNGSLILRRDIKEFYLGHSVKTKRANGRTWLLYNVTVNGCDVLQNKLGKQNPIAGAVIQQVKQLIHNVPTRCPAKKGIEFSLINFYLNEEILPFFVPIINFTATFHMLTKTDFIFKVNVTASIELNKRKSQ
ncbi:uncharacterized protein [Musca autumnalis]|uniref:uncharacterized protein n=1 Tax=Musca autumnalis TaxID=221902 RepID=UPI003CFB7536